jgi:hypothetical protein
MRLVAMENARSTYRLPYLCPKEATMHPTEAPPWTVNAWRRQRRATWVAIRLWLVVLLVGLIGFSIPFYLNRERVHKKEWAGHTRHTLSSNDETEGQFTLGLVSLGVAGVAAVAIIFAVRRHYVCPKCNEMSMRSWVSFGSSSFGYCRGLDLFPEACPNCGARLR